MSMARISQERDDGKQYGLYGPLAIFSGTSNPELARQIAEVLGNNLGSVTVRQFANENIFAQLEESVRGKDVFLIQPTCTGLRYRRRKAGECVVDPAVLAQLSPDEYDQVDVSINDNIMELLVLLDTLRRDSAGRLTAVIPYFAYGRTDKKDQPRVPITARLMADIISAAGANRFVVIDLHAGQIQGFLTSLEMSSRHDTSSSATSERRTSPMLLSSRPTSVPAAELAISRKTWTYHWLSLRSVGIPTEAGPAS